MGESVVAWTCCELVALVEVVWWMEYHTMTQKLIPLLLSKSALMLISCFQGVDRHFAVVGVFEGARAVVIGEVIAEGDQCLAEGFEVNRSVSWVRGDENKVGGEEKRTDVVFRCVKARSISLLRALCVGIGGGQCPP